MTEFWANIATTLVCSIMLGIEIGRWRERGDYWLKRSARRQSESLGALASSAKESDQ